MYAGPPLCPVGMYGWCLLTPSILPLPGPGPHGSGEGTSITRRKITEEPALVESCSLLHGLELICSALEQEGLQLFGVHSYLFSLHI